MKGNGRIMSAMGGVQNLTLMDLAIMGIGRTMKKTVRACSQTPMEINSNSCGRMESSSKKQQHRQINDVFKVFIC